MTKKKGSLRASWSCIDLQTFKNKQGVNLDDPFTDRDEPRRHVRSNSFNTRFDLFEHRPRKGIWKKEEGLRPETESDENSTSSESEQDSDSDSEDFDFEEVYLKLTR